MSARRNPQLAVFIGDARCGTLTEAGTGALIELERAAAAGLPGVGRAAGPAQKEVGAHYRRALLAR